MSPWETFEHEADVGLLVRGRDGPDLFAQAGLAFYELVSDLDAVEQRERYRLTGRAGDVEALLVDWLNDLVFLFQGRGVVCSGFLFEAWSETAYEGVGLGEPSDPGRHAPRDLVKAATYHGLSVTATPDGLEARVILDV